MSFKHFTRFFLLIGMIGFLTASMKAEEVTIGSGTTTNAWLPSHSYYKYSLTQQIYTAEEIGEAGEINSIAFYNGGSEKTRTYDIYLVNTEKSSFSGSSDWISVTADDLVFSGSVTMGAGNWTTIAFNSSFQYEGDNLAVVVNDKTGGYSQGMECRVFTPSGDQGVVSLYAAKDGSVNYDLSNPGNASGTVTFKNQIILDIESAAVSCAKPKSFAATDITAHSATLTWVAGAEGQSNWEVYVTTTETDIPDENTTPTYQVTNCTQALSNLTAQTTYYAYVRANCGGGDKSKWTSTSFTTTRESLTVDAANPYSQSFEENNDWTFSNGTFTNQWWWGSATNNGGEKAIYISDDNGEHYNYTHTALVVYASKLFNFAQGTYTFSFDWNAKGESSYDFLRVALVPGDKTFTAGGSLPSGITASSLPNTWIALDGGSKLNLSDDWQTKVTEAALSGTYTMVFLWRNDGSGGNQPPAAIDNISISFMTCPRPSGLTASNITGRTATITWTENGTATEWVLQYATNATFTENLSEITASELASRDLLGLNPETKYYVRVKSILGNEESSWSDVIDFTTTATCEKPTLSYVTNSNTAHTGSVSWTGNADHYELIYSTAYSFEPGDEGVTQINLDNVNTYTLQDLAPETTYRIKVRANCGEEDGYSQWSNQISFTTTATCVAPTGLTATATSSSITFSWTAGATGQDAWDIRYKANTDSEYTYVHLDNQTTTSYTIDGLTPVTAYSVNVRADCSEEDQSKWGYSTNQNTDLTVTTECGALSLPFEYGFEENLLTTSPYSSSNPFPKCWNRIAFQSGYYGSYTYYPYVFTATTSQPYAHGGNGANSYSGHSLRFYQTSSSTNECAVLPEISTEYNMNKVQIRFWAAVQSSHGTMQIGIMESPTDASTFTSIQSVTISNTYSDGFQEFTVPFSTYTGNGRYIAFMCGTGSAYAYFLIDDITVEVIPSCLVPTELDAEEITENEAVLSWTPTGTETAWNIQYKKASDSEWSEPIAVDETTYTLTGLQRATEYEARVQANCNDDDQSDWTNLVSFATECGIWPIDAQHPFFEDFNGETFPPVCWQKVNFGGMGITNGWLQSFNNSLDNQGAVSSDFKYETWLFLPLMHIDGEAALSFDHLFGSGSEYIPSSVMVSTNPDFDVEAILEDGFINTHFEQLWTADEDNLPSTKRNEVLSLSDYDGEDLYIAFRYEGTYNYSGRMWYIDNVQITVTAHQSVELTQGWNWFSTYIKNDDPVALLEMLKDALGDNAQEIQSYDDNTEYNDGEWFGGLDEIGITNDKTYMILVSNDCTIELQGPVTNPADYPITINIGWNWIGFPFDQEVEIAVAFADFDAKEGDVIQVSNDQTEFDGDEWFGDIQRLIPGQGIMYYSNSNEVKTLIIKTKAPEK